MRRGDPVYLSVALIIEEGFSMTDLEKIVSEMGMAAKTAGVTVVTGDTKVVEKGKGDGIFINTSGIGEVIEGTSIGPELCSPGDVVIINGAIADHGIAIISKREGLSFESTVKSDTASLSAMVIDVLKEYKSVHVLRDPTRGGLASALNEICEASHTGILLDENKIAINNSVRGACGGHSGGVSGHQCHRTP